MSAILRLLVSLLTVFGLALAGWFLYRAVRARVGGAGNILLLAIMLCLSAVTVRVVILLNPGPPLRVVWWTVLVGGTIALAYFVLKAFPSSAPLWLAAVLGSPRPRRVTPPATVISRAGVGPGMTVVEVGAGSGHLSFDVAKLLLPGGRLICVDVQPEIIRAIRTKVAASGINNIETHIAFAEQLPAGILDADLVMFVAVLGAVTDMQSALAEAFRVLKPGGVLSISEFIGAPHYCSKEEAKRQATQAGFGDWSIEGDALGYTANLRKPQTAALRPQTATRPADLTGNPGTRTEHQDESPPGESGSP